MNHPDVRIITRASLVFCLSAVAGCARTTAVSPTGSAKDLARDHLRAGRVPQALTALDEAKREDPQDLEPYLAKSQILEQSGNFKGALQEARSAHKLKPEDSAAALRAMYLSSDFTTSEELESIARTVSKLVPDNPDAHLFIGNAIARSENAARFSEAIKAYQEANRLAPFAAAPLLGMGRLYLRMGDIERGTAMLAHAVRVLEEAPPGPMQIPQLTQWIEERRTAAFALGQSAAKAGNAAEARKYSQEATLWSRRASELRSLKNRATSLPPDVSSRERLARIAAAGPRSWPD